ncbi:uncharacterized protein LOC124164137 isoform X2 [Ischnura elegans]|uniref:uncharacterized protein LOC124164137 isoform X2 n=1 Tax=Ischnura elegans TaxID=197161 RepID=UPI001ED87DE7|nr:uncharacterized protein LOC124164137 isoform X2 [Ischnura elegans]
MEINLVQREVKLLQKLLLLSNDFLQNLDIGETDQTIESIVYIAAVLRSPDVKLKSLNLSRPLIKFSEAHAAEILGQMLFMNSSLTELILEKCGFIDHDIELLATGLHKFMNERFHLPIPDSPAMKYKEAKSCSSYETVVSVERYMNERGLLAKNDDHDGNVNHDTESIGTAEESVESVECGCNNQKEIKDITHYQGDDYNPLNRVVVNGSLVSYLKHLDLSCNNLSDFSIGYLGPYFLSKPPLVILSLAFNLISDLGAVELSRYLPSTSIEVLDISHNNIDSEGIQNLIYHLMHPSRMKKLYIWGNRLNDNVCKILHPTSLMTCDQPLYFAHLLWRI